MRQLKEVHPEYADRVNVLAVGVDPGESAEKILDYKNSSGFTWPMTTADSAMLRAYGVTGQATYASLDSNSIILEGVTSGSHNADDWRKVFDGLLGS